MKGRRIYFTLIMAMAIFAVAFHFFTPATFGQEKSEKKKDLPPRGILVAPEYTSIAVLEGEDVSIDLAVTNLGREDENIDLAIPQVPKGWKARIKTYSFDVAGVHVPSDKSKSLTLKAEPDKDIPLGKYVFGIKAQTQDGKLTSASQVTITVKEKDKSTKTKGLNINTSYPVLQGPTDAKFDFSVEVENKLDKDSIFNVPAQGPTNWDVNLKPAYEEKFISSLRLKAGQSQTMAVEVRPYMLAEPGKYPIETAYYRWLRENTRLIWRSDPKAVSGPELEIRELPCSSSPAATSILMDPPRRWALPRIVFLSMSRSMTSGGSRILAQAFISSLFS